MSSKTISVALDFTRTPGTRFREHGKYSGEEFRDEFLVPFFRQATDDDTVTIDLDGTEGYATSFLEEAFGGLARIYDASTILRRLRLVSSRDTLLPDEIRHYITSGQRSQ